MLNRNCSGNSGRLKVFYSFLILTFLTFHSLMKSQDSCQALTHILLTFSDKFTKTHIAFWISLYTEHHNKIQQSYLITQGSCVILHGSLFIPEASMSLVIRSKNSFLPTKSMTQQNFISCPQHRPKKENHFWELRLILHNMNLLKMN